MSLRIELDWENPQAAKGPELQATWARLTILINDAPITQVQDYGARSVRDGIYVPLYPLAEWLAIHWWFLFHEYETPGRAVQASYAKRHNLRYAREGFALPHLNISPMGPRVCLAWKSVDMPAEKVRFLQEGTAHFDTEIVWEVLANFIRTVLQRLELEGLSNTFLEDEWKVIEAEEGVHEEREFCEASAALGLDPYSMTDSDREALVRASERLPVNLTKDFFSIANIHDLRGQVQKLLDGIQQIGQLPGDLVPLKNLRAHTPKIDSLRTPWEQGYEFARKLRKQLGFTDRLIKNMQDFSAILGVDDTALQQAILPSQDSFRFFDALIGVNENDSPGFFIEKRQEESKRFAFCRSLFEYLTSEALAPTLISATRSERQKRNRAFAAEFLAPAALLKTRLSSEVLGEGEVDDLAADFGVSPYTINHQIENHRLARLISD